MNITLEELAAPPHTIATKHGRMRLSSLRPGAWLKAEDAQFPPVYILVTINSAKLQRVVVKFCGKDSSDSVRYDAVERCGWQFVGHGKRRVWHRYLPRWLKRHVCEFGRPA